MGAVWTDSPEVKRIAEALIESESVFSDIKYYEPKIAYLFKSAEKSNELGKCSKATGAWKYLADGVDYVIFAWKEWFQDASVSEKEALVYHELMHVEIAESDKGEIKFRIRKHDVESFIKEVQKYNDWHTSLTQLKSAFEGE